MEQTRVSERIRGESFQMEIFRDKSRVLINCYTKEKLIVNNTINKKARNGIFIVSNDIFFDEYIF